MFKTWPKKKTHLITETYPLIGTTGGSVVFTDDPSKDHFPAPCSTSKPKGNGRPINGIRTGKGTCTRQTNET